MASIQLHPTFEDIKSERVNRTLTSDEKQRQMKATKSLKRMKNNHNREFLLPQFDNENSGIEAYSKEAFDYTRNFRKEINWTKIATISGIIGSIISILVTILL